MGKGVADRVPLASPPVERARQAAAAAYDRAGGAVDLDLPGLQAAIAALVAYAAQPEVVSSLQRSREPELAASTDPDDLEALAAVLDRLSDQGQALSQKVQELLDPLRHVGSSVGSRRWSVRARVERVRKELARRAMRKQMADLAPFRDVLDGTIELPADLLIEELPLAPASGNPVTIRWCSMYGPPSPHSNWPNELVRTVGEMRARLAQGWTFRGYEKSRGLDEDRPRLNYRFSNRTASKKVSELYVGRRLLAQVVARHLARSAAPAA